MLPSRPSDLARVVKVVHRTRLKIFTSKQMLQRLPIALVQVKAGILNETRSFIYSFYWEKEITKKVYNNIMSSINL